MTEPEQDGVWRVYINGRWVEAPVGEVWVVTQSVDGGSYDDFVGVAATRDSGKAVAQRAFERFARPVAPQLEWEDDPLGLESSDLVDGVDPDLSRDSLWRYSIRRMKVER